MRENSLVKPKEKKMQLCVTIRVTANVSDPIAGPALSPALAPLTQVFASDLGHYFVPAVGLLS